MPCRLPLPMRRRQVSESVGAQDLPLEARLEAHALLDRLTMDGTRFSRDDARRLIALIPVTPRRRFSFTGLFQGRGPGLRGRAAGIGDVELDGEGKERRVSWNAPAISQDRGLRGHSYARPDCHRADVDRDARGLIRSEPASCFTRPRRESQERWRFPFREP